MLVLRRCPGETIVIGEGEITITVLSIEGRRVKLGICAPKDLQVVRQELQEDRPPTLRASHRRRALPRQQRPSSL